MTEQFFEIFKTLLRGHFSDIVLVNIWTFILMFFPFTIFYLVMEKSCRVRALDVFLVFFIFTKQLFSHLIYLFLFVNSRKNLKVSRDRKPASMV